MLKAFHALPYTSLVALDGGKKIREWRPVHWRSFGSIKEVDRKRKFSVYEMIEGTSLVALDGGKKIRGWRPVRCRSMNGSINQVNRRRKFSVNEMNEPTCECFSPRRWAWACPWTWSTAPGEARGTMNSVRRKGNSTKCFYKCKTKLLFVALVVKPS